MMQETGALRNRLLSPCYDTRHGLQILKIGLQEAFDHWETARLRVIIQKFITVHRGAKMLLKGQPPLGSACPYGQPKSYELR